MQREADCSAPLAMALLRQELRNRLGFWVEYEVVCDGDALAVFGWFWIQHQFWLDCRGDVVVVVWVAWEVQLGSQQLVAWGRNLQVQVSWTPGVPTAQRSAGYRHRRLGSGTEQAGSNSSRIQRCR